MAPSKTQAATAAKSATTVTIYGRLSFPVFNHKEAVARNVKSKFPKDAADVTPEFNLLVEQAQLDKFRTFVKDTFLPYCLEQSEAGEKRNALDAKEIKRVLGVVDGDWENQPPFIPIKVVNEKTAVLVPEAVASIKVVGNKGVDMELKAIVNAEDELVVPDPDILTFPVIRPIGQTVHQMYAGCYVAATLNLYAYTSTAPGFSASASTAVFKADGDRLGGGQAVDEDEIFLD